MTFEARKVQMTGGSTYLVTLPKRWVKDSNIKAGDVVFFTKTTDGGLYLRAGRAADRGARKAILKVSKSEKREHLLRRLIGAYIAGSDVLEVDFGSHHDPETRRVVREFTRMAIGPEILEETKNTIVIQDLSDTAQFSQEKCLRRMYLTIKSMHEEAMTALRTMNEVLAKDVIARDDDIDRFYWMVAKQFNLMLIDAGLAAKQGIDMATSSSYRQAAKILERIGDHAQRIAKNVLLLDKKVDSVLMESLDAASTLAMNTYEKAFTSLLSGDVEAANSAIDSMAEMDKSMDKASEIIRTMKGRAVFALAGIIESVGRTGHYSTDLAEIAINQMSHRLATPIGGTEKN